MNQQILKKNSFSEEKLKAKVPIIRVRDNFVMTEEPFEVKYYPNCSWLDILNIEVCEVDDTIIKVTILEKDLRFAELFIKAMERRIKRYEKKFSEKMVLNRTYIFMTSDKILLNVTI